MTSRLGTIIDDTTPLAVKKGSPFGDFAYYGRHSNSSLTDPPFAPLRPGGVSLRRPQASSRRRRHESPDYDRHTCAIALQDYAAETQQSHMAISLVPWRPTPEVTQAHRPHRSFLSHGSDDRWVCAAATQPSLIRAVVENFTVSCARRPYSNALRMSVDEHDQFALVFINGDCYSAILLLHTP